MALDEADAQLAALCCGSDNAGPAYCQVSFKFLFFFFFDENLLKAYYMNYQHITYNCTRDTDRTDRTDPFHHLYRPNIEISLTCTKDSNAQIDKNCYNIIRKKLE